MCIVLFTTAHPQYSLILINNRDEFVLRPTSLPHWWKHPTSGQQVLSSRDLQRAARGTWLGITKTGILAVLTNYQEKTQPVYGMKSRGQIMNAWLGELPDLGVKNGVHTLIQDGGFQGVGGFSMICGKLRRNNSSIAILSNRAADVNDVPIINLEEDGCWGLSNTVYGDPDEWPKVSTGKFLLKKAIHEAVEKQSSEDTLLAKLFSILDSDTMPQRLSGLKMMDYCRLMKYTIFVPLIGDEEHRQTMQQAASKGRAACPSIASDSRASDRTAPAELPLVFEDGLYGTQRQTVLLVDLEGNATFVERALFDANGNELPRGENDVIYRFKIENWDD